MKCFENVEHFLKQQLRRCLTDKQFRIWRTLFQKSFFFKIFTKKNLDFILFRLD